MFKAGFRAKYRNKRNHRSNKTNDSIHLLKKAIYINYLE